MKDSSILIIGNGFDLSHKLPTTYIEFLSICKISTGPNSKKPEKYTGNNRLYKKFIDALDNNQIMRFRGLVMNNYWIYHFNSEATKINEKWIDFEEEISNVAFRAKKDMDSSDNGDPRFSLSKSTLLEYISKNRNIQKKSIYSYKELFSLLYTDHQRLTKALDIYMDCFVNKMHPPKNTFFKEHLFDRVLSFNYTVTYTEHYNPDIDCCYIHGRSNASVNSTCNLVLGFDDHYMQSSVIPELIYFEKYYQRIINQNDNQYFNWIDDINSSKDNTELYIYGHSLAPADGDILRAFILNPKVLTHIFYLDETDRAGKVKNLATVLGPDQLIKLTGGNSARILFHQIE